MVTKHFWEGGLFPKAWNDMDFSPIIMEVDHGPLKIKLIPGTPKVGIIVLQGWDDSPPRLGWLKFPTWNMVGKVNIYFLFMVDFQVHVKRKKTPPFFGTSMLVPSPEFQTNQSIQFIAGMIYRAPVIWGIIYFINNYVWIPIKPPVFQCFMENKAIFFSCLRCVRWLRREWWRRWNDFALSWPW